LPEKPLSGPSAGLVLRGFGSSWPGAPESADFDLLMRPVPEGLDFDVDPEEGFLPVPELDFSFKERKFGAQR
jgi:hypothetical protein